MRYSKGHKTVTRLRVIESAYRLFTANGYAATSIDAIMRECGLTRGGFYAHFASKSQLYREAVDHVAVAGLFGRQSVDHDDWIESLLDECLDVEDSVSRSGPIRMGFLAADLARGESDVRSAYTRAFKTISETLRQRIGAPACSEDLILSLTAMLVGAVAVARTTDDAALRNKLLTACRENAKALLESEMLRRPLNFFWSPAVSSAS